jgi:beta-N-acetylhexosaminidase
MQKKKIIVAACLWLVCGMSAVFAGGSRSKLSQNDWVDSVFNSMTAKERLGQLFMVAAYSNKDAAHKNELSKLIKEYNIGGLIFFQGGPVRQAKLTNMYQAEAKVPLMIGMDAEWGLAMRLDSTISFPKQMTLGAIADNQYIFKMGAEIARQCKRMGVHVNFAPVVDINSNPNNPVIGMRSFGENKEQVAAKGIAYMRGLQNYGVMANAKHFPGHGDTDTDSHTSLPVLKHSKKRMDEIELYPFKRLIADSLRSIMVAHLHVPAYDKASNRATTLSKYVVSDLLKKQLGFKGLIFTDALNMKGVSSFNKPGEVDLKALLAGNDVLLFSENVPEAINKIEEAIQDKDIPAKEVDKRVKKILAGKFWAGLSNYAPIAIENLHKELHLPQTEATVQELYAKAVTITKNDHKWLPFKTLDTTRFTSLAIGADQTTTFQKMLGNYAPFEHFHFSEKNKSKDFDTLMGLFKGKRRTIIVSFHKLNGSVSRNYGISDSSLTFVKKLQQKHNVIIVVFGNPYSLKNFVDFPAVVCSYEDNRYTQSVTPQVLFGAIESEATLPVTVAASMPVGTGFPTLALRRLRYGYPEEVQMNGEVLARIDSIAEKIIRQQATPGCQVLVAKDGVVVYDKSFGYLTYDKKQPVTDSTIYDIASITKVASTLQAVMYLYERGQLDVMAKASQYLPELVGTNKENLMISDILTHQSGLVPYIPYWKKTIKSVSLSETYYCNTKDNWFCNEVAPGVYSMKTMEDSLWIWTIQSDLLAPNKQGKYDYKYSDLGFYIMKRVVEKLLNKPIQDFNAQTFYEPLGLSTLTFRPLERFPISNIAPTEQDIQFRGKLLQGTVHDQGAAMFGGVAGHAGLFSNAHDLAVLMQMNMQLGYYGGIQYFAPSVLPVFTKKFFDRNRRGLGWDKPLPRGGGPTSKMASASTFGHTGFTGTAVWADPDHRVVFVFLSNRVYPDAENLKLISNNIRPKIQDVIYESILANYPNVRPSTTTAVTPASVGTN